MRVVHLVIDGFDPKLAMEDKDTGFKVLDRSDAFLSNYVKIAEESREWKTVDYIPSNFSWARIYSGQEYNKVINLENPYNPENYNENNAHYTNYRNIPHGEFLWNKLSNLGVENYWFPYFKVTKMLRRTYKDIVKSNLTHITSVDYRESTATVIENCKRSNINYNSYTDFYDSDELGQKSKELIDLWRSNANSKEFEDCYDKILIPGLIKACNKNLDCYKRFVKETKSNCDLRNSDNEFIHISSIELDAFYHYSIPSSSISTLMKSFYNKLLDIVISGLNPDYLIITGDHGFRFFNKNEEHLKEYYGRPVRYVKEFYTQYGNIISTKAIFNDFAFSRTHNNSQGYIIYEKNNLLLGDHLDKLAEVSSKFSMINPASDDIYNLLCDKEFWKDVK